MNDRLPWKKGDRPKHFIATMPDGFAEVWWQETGTDGPSGWRYKTVCGQYIESHVTSSKQDAADHATRLWPAVLRQERARLARIEEGRELEAQLDAAFQSGKLDVMAFGLGTSAYDRLVRINEFLRRKRMLEGALRPLAEAVSAELYRRRVGA